MCQIFFLLLKLAAVVFRDDTYNDHMADVPAAEFRVGGILHIDDPAGNEDAHPCQEKVLHLNGWETTLRGSGRKGLDGMEKKNTQKVKKTQQLVMKIDLNYSD